MTQVSVQEAKMNLESLLELMLNGEDVLIERSGQAPIRLRATVEKRRKRRLGGGRGIVTYMAEDFDAPLQDFADYM